MKSLGELFGRGGAVVAIVACGVWYAQSPRLPQRVSFGSPDSPAPPPSVVAIDFSAEGARLLTLSRGTRDVADPVLLHDLGTGGCSSLFAAKGFDRGVLSLDGAHVALGSIYGDLWWVKVESGEPQPLMEPLPAASVRAVAVARTGLVAAATFDSQLCAHVYLCDPAGQTVRQVPDLPQGQISIVHFSEDGRRLLAAGSRGALAIWDLPVPGPPLVLPGEGQPIGAEFLGGSERVVSATVDGALRICEVSSGREEWQWKADFGGAGISALAVSPDGSTIALGGFNRSVAIWDVLARRAALEIAVPLSYVSQVRYSPDGNTLAIAGSEPTVRLHDVRTGALRKMIDIRP